jgi:hypothetical protein
LKTNNTGTCQHQLCKEFELFGQINIHTRTSRLFCFPEIFIVYND